jgi:glycosyltransferase involved in cell wall biosynthesis
MNAETRTAPDTQLDASLFITQYGAGGVERMMVQTARALAERGLRVALVLASNQGAYLDTLPSTVEQVILDANDLHRALTTHLTERRPSVAISGKLGDDRLLIDARDRANVRTRVFFRVGNPLGYRLSARGITPFGRWFKLHRLRALYRRADGCIAVSKGNRDDLRDRLRVPTSRIHVLPNPVITPEFYQSAAKDPGHPWLAEGEPPVVLGVGGLRQQKDFGTLIEAFAQVRRGRECRLIILGEGRQRERLARLADRLGVSADVDLAGWRGNSHAYMARAAVFALSSRWEGLGNVMIESAALGTPIVATDCPYGPREILQDGRYGELVATGNPSALARGIERTLDHPPSGTLIQQAAEPYRMEESARRYALALGLEGPDVDRRT